jgi:hypothetical protein
MAILYNIYCDESCHLEHDKVNDTAMVIGGIWCPNEKKKAIFDRIREIKQEHGIGRDAEIKWNKVSPAQYQYYLDLVNYFFDNSDLHFRAVVIPDKRQLNHDAFRQTHDEFYYKTYFRMLKGVLEPGNEYAIYIDIKDTRSQKKVEKLHDVLCNSNYDFKREMIHRVQQVKSNEIELMGLADLLIGALSYLHRGLSTSTAKLDLIERIRKRSGYTLQSSTLYREEKFNIFVWEPKHDQ